MIAARPVCLLVVLLATTSGCTLLSRVDLGRLVTSGRDGWQHPEQVITALELEPGDRVAEIGAGDGYWLPWLSEAVGPEGRVYAVEVDDEKIETLHQRVADEALANVVVVRGQYEDPELPDAEIDLAMTCLTYHHIEDRPSYFARLRTDLSRRGRVAHLDDRHDVPPPFRWLQGSGHWSDPEAIRAEMEQAGYERIAGFDFLPLQSFQVFEPAPIEEARR
ncbi:MAG: methyltransferase domain-containing protein [Myxococcota bacterium]